MIELLSENAGTIIAGAVLLTVVTAVIAKLVHDHHKGKCVGCSCGCKKK